MRRFYICSMLFTLLAVGMRAAGNTQPIHPALRGFVEGCEGVPQPCWYGIVPGVTTIETASLLLQQHRYRILRQSASHLFIATNLNVNCDRWLKIDYDGLVYGATIRLGQCAFITPGDLTSVAGQLTAVDICNYFTDNETTRYFDDDGLSVMIDKTDNSTPWLSLLDPIDEIEIFQPIYNPQNIWHGYLPLWRYLQLEPAFSYCNR